MIAGVTIHRTLPEHAGHRQATVDWQGGLLLFLSTTLLLIALTEASLVWALVTLLSMGAFAYVERKAADPILPFALFRNRTVAVAAAIGFLAGMVLFGTLAFIPLLVQVTTGGSATSAGQLLTPLYLTWVLASILAARLLLRIGARVAAIVGATALFVSSLALPWLAVESSRTAVFADIALMGAGLGFALLSLLLAVQHSVSRTELGVATSFNMFARTIGGAAGVAIMGAISTAGVGVSLQVSATVDVAVLSNLSPDSRHRVIVSVQRAFASGAVAAALALVAAFWMPPLAGHISSSAAAEMISGDIAPLGPERERMAVDR